MPVERRGGFRYCGGGRNILRGAVRIDPIPTTTPSPSAETAGLAPPVPEPVPMPPQGRFTEGSILRHVLVMTGTSTVGIVALFVVDFLSLLYVSRLHDTALTAAVGYASQVLFYPTSINIGLTIGVTALVSRMLGAGRRPDARRLAAAGLFYALVASVAVALATWWFVAPILDGLGATGEARGVAVRFLAITLPGNVPLAAGMVLSGVLRAVGDARRAMYVTLAGGIVTGLIDPVLIFGLHLGVYGAAVSTVVARLVFMIVGYHGVVRIHDLVGRPSLADLRRDLRPALGIAMPAVATNLATPVGNSYVLHLFSQFGEAAVAATTIVDRVVPLAFAALFALSGAVGPILGQNLGAGRLDRVTGTLSASFGLTVGYVLAVWGLLWLGSPALLAIFEPTPAAADLIVFFCTYGVSAWLFIGLLFVANASFNNLGFPWLSLLFNWGRATLGTVPFAALGVHLGGVRGGQLGIAGGAAIFGLGAVITAFLVSRMAGRSAAAP